MAAHLCRAEGRPTHFYFKLQSISGRYRHEAEDEEKVAAAFPCSANSARRSSEEPENWPNLQNSIERGNGEQQWYCPCVILGGGLRAHLPISLSPTLLSLPTAVGPPLARAASMPLFLHVCNCESASKNSAILQTGLQLYEQNNRASLVKFTSYAKLS